MKQLHFLLDPSQPAQGWAAFAFASSTVDGSRAIGLFGTMNLHDPGEGSA